MLRNAGQIILAPRSGVLVGKGVTSLLRHTLHEGAAHGRKTWDRLGTELNWVSCYGRERNCKAKSSVMCLVSLPHAIVVLLRAHEQLPKHVLLR
jgi:hypothetical protein